MRGSFRWKLVCFLLLFLLPASLHGQAVRQRPPYQPGPPAAAQIADPRAQRAAREKAVAIVGTKGRDFVESYGEDAVAALFACSRPAAVRLVEFHASGGLAKLPRPRDLLRVIGKPNHGNEVAAWAMAHLGELQDADHFDAYLLDPLSYALALKSLEDGAAEMRERRRAQDYLAQRAEWPSRSANGGRMFVLGGGVATVVLLLAWRFRRRGAWNPPGP